MDIKICVEIMSIIQTLQRSEDWPIMMISKQKKKKSRQHKNNVINTKNH